MKPATTKSITADDLAGPVDTVVAVYESPNNLTRQSKKLICRTTLNALGFSGASFLIVQNGQVIDMTIELRKAIETYNNI